MAILAIGGPEVLWSQLPKETGGFIRVEAESFSYQELDSIRKWYLVGSNSAGPSSTEEDFISQSASAHQYIQIKPDTRQNHNEKLIKGENFSNVPGKLAVVHYPVEFENPGRYFVWVRAFSNGSEDNGLHVGINGEWPETGQRMQWCEGKNQWTWGSKQRTASEHCGVERQIYLDVLNPGRHTISFSMREDGFKFDAWVMTQEYKMPE